MKRQPSENGTQVDPIDDRTVRVHYSLKWGPRHSSHTHKKGFKKIKLTPFSRRIIQQRIHLKQISIRKVVQQYLTTHR